jgi:hypothetical protein
MVVGLQDFLEPEPFRAGADADPRDGSRAGGHVRNHQARARQEIPSAAGWIKSQGEHGRRGQRAARVRGRDQMKTQGPPTGRRIIPHQLEGTFRGTRDEAQPSSTGLDHGPGRDLRHEDQM